MGKVVLKDAYVEIDGVDLSDHGNHVTINSEKDEVDVTGFGAANKEIALGLGDGSIQVKFVQDFDAGSVDATLWAIHSTDDTAVVVIRASSAAASATNPEYQMTGVLPAYTPLDADLGQASEIQANFRNADQAGITRATS